MIEDENKVKMKYYDRINKQQLELVVDKSVKRTINKYNKREKRQKDKLEEYEVMSIEYLEESGFEIESYDLNEEQKELLSLEEKRKRKIKLALYRAMRKLTPRQKQVVSMKYFEKKSHVEISKITGLDQSTISKYLRDSYEKMKKTVKNDAN